MRKKNKGNIKKYKPRTLWTHKNINKVFKDKKKELKKKGGKIDYE